MTSKIIYRDTRFAYVEQLFSMRGERHVWVPVETKLRHGQTTRAPLGLIGSCNEVKPIYPDD